VDILCTKYGKNTVPTNDEKHAASRNGGALV